MASDSKGGSSGDHDQTDKRRGLSARVDQASITDPSSFMPFDRKRIERRDDGKSLDAGEVVLSRPSRPLTVHIPSANSSDAPSSDGVNTGDAPSQEIDREGLQQPDLSKDIAAVDLTKPAQSNRSTNRFGLGGTPRADQQNYGEDRDKLREAIRKSIADAADAAELRNSTESLLGILNDIVASDDLWDRIERAAGRPASLTADDARRILTVSEVDWSLLLTELGYTKDPEPKILTNELTASLRDSLSGEARADPQQTREKLRQFTETIRRELDEYDAAPAEHRKGWLERLWREVRFVLERVGLLVGVVSLGMGAGTLVPELTSVFGPQSAELGHSLLAHTTEKLVDATLDGWQRHHADLRNPRDWNVQAVDRLGSRELRQALEQSDYIRARKLVFRHSLDFHITWDMASSSDRSDYRMTRHFMRLSEQLYEVEKELSRDKPSLADISERISSIEVLSREAAAMTPRRRNDHSKHM